MSKQSGIDEIEGGERRSGFRQRLFAWMHRQGENATYDRTVAPYKRALFSELSGTVLEIGAGTGENFPFYPAGLHWIGIEPNVYMHEQLLERARASGISGQLRAAVAEQLPVEDGSIDAVVSTLVMCSVGDQDSVLREIKRVLRPGGRYLFIEHVAGEGGQLTRQRLIKPFWRILADGCEPDRDTGAAIRRAGFSSVEIQCFKVSVPIVSPHIMGTAIK